MNLTTAIKSGFDRSTQKAFSDAIYIRCSQCEAICVNGIPIHETGCPNEPSQCFECGDFIPRNHRYCAECAQEAV